MLFRWLTLFLDFPAEAFDAGVAFWREVTGSELSPFRGPAGEFATLLPPAADAYLRVQRTADGSSGCHLDLHVDPAAGTVDQAADRAVALGATVRHASEGLVIADSPGGFTFCLVRWNGENTVPPPTSLNTGGASRADQLCLDIPPDAFEREGAFWAALTGWDLRAGTRPEFAYLDRPTRFPSGCCSSAVTTRTRSTRSRATSTSPAPAASSWPPGTPRPARGSYRHSSHWITMADPAGHLYCLTGRDPQTGRLPAPAA